jgi:hypothetical protein
VPLLCGVKCLCTPLSQSFVPRSDRYLERKRFTFRGPEVWADIHQATAPMAPTSCLKMQLGSCTFLFTNFFLPTTLQVHYNLLCLRPNWSNTPPYLPLPHKWSLLDKGGCQAQANTKWIHLASSMGTQQWVFQETAKVSFALGLFSLSTSWSGKSRPGPLFQEHHNQPLWHTNLVPGAVLATPSSLSQMHSLTRLWSTSSSSHDDVLPQGCSHATLCHNPTKANK